MKYYALCGFGGILSCGITHTAVVPLDLVKCRIQVSISILKQALIFLYYLGTGDSQILFIAFIPVTFIYNKNKEEILHANYFKFTRGKKINLSCFW